MLSKASPSDYVVVFISLVLSEYMFMMLSALFVFIYMAQHYCIRCFCSQTGIVAHWQRGLDILSLCAAPRATSTGYFIFSIGAMYTMSPPSLPMVYVQCPVQLVYIVIEAIQIYCCTE